MFKILFKFNEKSPNYEIFKFYGKVIKFRGSAASLTEVIKKTIWKRAESAPPPPPPPYVDKD